MAGVSGPAADAPGAGPGIGADGVPSFGWATERITNSLEVPRKFVDLRSDPVPVRARLVWQQSGEQHIDTHATAWRRARGEVPMVLVVVDDPRSVVRGVWLPAHDVQRR